MANQTDHQSNSAGAASAVSKSAGSRARKAKSPSAAAATAPAASRPTPALTSLPGLGHNQPPEDTVEELIRREAYPKKLGDLIDAQAALIREHSRKIETSAHAVMKACVGLVWIANNVEEDRLRALGVLPSADFKRLSNSKRRIAVEAKDCKGLLESKLSGIYGPSTIKRIVEHASFILKGIYKSKDELAQALGGYPTQSALQKEIDAENRANPTSRQKKGADLKRGAKLALIVENASKKGFVGEIASGDGNGSLLPVGHLRFAALIGLEGENTGVLPPIRGTTDKQKEKVEKAFAMLTDVQLELWNVGKDKIEQRYKDMKGKKP